jgi:hypothetical protein
VPPAALITGAELRPLLQGLTTGKTRDSDRILAEVDAQHPSLLVVDAWSLRYVFHYHLRPGMIFIGEKTRPGSGAPFAQRKYPDECWVISAETVLDRNLHEPGLPVPHPLMICSHPVGQWVTNAGEVKVVPATGP